LPDEPRFAPRLKALENDRPAICYHEPDGAHARFRRQHERLEETGLRFGAASISRAARQRV